MLAMKSGPFQIGSLTSSEITVPSDQQKYIVYQQSIHLWSCKDFDAKINRVSTYIKENKTIFILNVPGTIGGGFVAGAALGSGVGGGVGFAVGNIPGAAAGAIIGGIAGAGMGLVVGGATAALLTKDNYILWKRYRRYEDMIPVLLNLQKNHPSFEAYCCPITNDIFQDPVMLPTGVTYERVEITKFFHSKGGSAQDPLKTGIFSEGNLYDDYATRGYILKALDILIGEDLINLNFNSDDHKALTSLVRDVQNQIKQLEIKGRELILDLYKKNIVNIRVYTYYNDKLNGLVGS